MENNDVKAKADSFYNKLIDPSSKLVEKYIAIFELRTIADTHAAECLIKAFPYQADSELLKHEIGYALGQIKNPSSVDFLVNVIQDDNEFTIVRHEAAEALAYLNEEKYAELLLKYYDSPIDELRDTCRIGLSRLQDPDAMLSKGAAKYGGTLEPAPPFKKEAILEILKEKYGVNVDTLNDNLVDYVFKYILDPDTQVYNKYKATYFLREVESRQAAEALGNLLKPEYRKLTGPLLRHEICFIFGQLGDKGEVAINNIIKTMDDLSENEIVRHEALSAYSAISLDKKPIEKYLNDSSRVVKESAIVCLEMIDNENKGC